MARFPLLAAGLIWFGGLSYADLFSSVSVTDAGGFKTCFNANSGTSGTVTASIPSCNLSAGGAVFAGLGTANASYGALSAYADGTITLTDKTSNEQIAVSSEAFLSDHLTLSKASPNPVFVEVSADISGSAGLGSYGQIDLDWGPQCELLTASSGSCSSMLELFPGQSALMSLQLDAEVAFLLGGVAGDSYEAVADYSHTAFIRSIQVFDLNMNPLSNVPLTASSGFQYPLENGPSAIPEPSAVVLTLTAICLSVSARIKRNSLRRKDVA